MTVKVSKPAFNLREKLSELDIPVGTHGTQLMKSVDASESFSLVKAGRKNMIINGAMQVNQRNGGSSVTIPDSTGGTYQLDRWAVNETTGGTVSVNMDGDPPTQPLTGVGQFQKAMQIACIGTDTSLASTQNLHFFQNIEGYNTTHLQWGTVAAKPVTLSFWIKTNKAGTYCVGLENSGTDRCCIREYYQKGNSIWNKVVLTFTGCPDGTWLKTNGIGIRVRFCLASGTNFDDGVDGSWVSSDEYTTGNQANFMTSTSNRFFITGVQLEEGTAATPFEHLTYQEDHLNCARYYQEQQGGSDVFMYAAKAQGSASGDIGVGLVVPMRASPAVTCSNHRLFHSDGVGYSNSTTAPTVSQWDANHSIHSATIALNAGGHSSVANNECCTWSPSSAALTFDSEL